MNYSEFMKNYKIARTPFASPKTLKIPEELLIQNKKGAGTKRGNPKVVKFCHW